VPWQCEGRLFDGGTGQLQLSLELLSAFVASVWCDGSFSVDYLTEGGTGQLQLSLELLSAFVGSVWCDGSFMVDCLTEGGTGQLQLSLVLLLRSHLVIYIHNSHIFVDCFSGMNCY